MISDVAPIGTVKTVVGANDAWSLGRTNYHEHLFQITPLLPADELDDDRINRATGVHVVATTGGHREARYAPGTGSWSSVRVSS